MSDTPTLSERVQVAIWLLRRSTGAEDLTDEQALVLAAILVLGGDS